MVVQKKQLLEVLKSCIPGIESGNSTLEGADSFIFHNGNIHSYNDTVSVTVPIEQSGLVEEEIEGAVKAEEFFNVISKMPSDEITFEVNENSWSIKSGKAKAEMSLMNFDFESRMNGIEPNDDWNEVTDEFINGLMACKMSGNKTSMSGIYINGGDVISTDGWQMNRYQMSDCNLPAFWITDKSVNELLKLNKIVEMQLNGTWVHFKTENGTIFSVKTLQIDNFPYDKINALIERSEPSENDFHNVLPAELFNAIDRAVSFGMEVDEHKVVRLVISKDGIEVSSEKISGKYSEKVAWSEEITGDIEEVQIYVDSTMMGFVSTNGGEFYLLKKSDKINLMFKTEKSISILSTFKMKD